MYHIENVWVRVVCQAVSPGRDADSSAALRNDKPGGSGFWCWVWVPGFGVGRPVSGWPVSGCQLSVLPLLLSVLPLLLLSVVPLFLLYQVGGVEHVFHFGAVKRCE